MKSIIIALFFLSSHVTAQEESVAGIPKGPHGGYFENAKEYFVEIVPDKKDAFRVYLLDQNMKTPYIRYSNVSGWTENARGTKSEILCVANKDHFDCTTRDISLKSGTSLVLRTDRNYVRGEDVAFSLPFAIELPEDKPKKSRRKAASKSTSKSKSKSKTKSKAQTKKKN